MLAWVLLFLAIWFGLGVFRVRAGARLCVLVGLWAGVILVLALAPGSRAAQPFGDIRVWLIAGGLAGAVLAYRLTLKYMHSLAVETGDAPGTIGGEPQAIPVTSGLSDSELDRYARHIVLREIGGPGQQKLRAANVLIVGMGALGSPVGLYLAAAGAGRITLADDDTVSLSNLQRQVIFDQDDLGRPKVRAAARHLSALNPHVRVTALERRIGAGDADMLRGFDLVLDGTDSFTARAGVNAACVRAGVPLVAGSIAQWEGQLTVWDPAGDAPCMACIFPRAPAAGLAPSCAEAGVVGALPGIIGSMMALEAIRMITGAGATSRGKLLVFDGLWGETRSIGIRRDPACPVCGAMT